MNKKIDDVAAEKGIYTAVLIEPRQHRAMSFVLSNFAEMLDERWNFLIFHGLNNRKYIENIIITIPILNKHKHRFSFIQLNVNNLNQLAYNTLFLETRLYDFIPTEMFLIFQMDTMISEKYKDYIYKFMDYDYVGAPWNKSLNSPIVSGKVGNGGISLRRKSKMLEIIAKCSDLKKETHDLLHNEDIFFSVISESRVIVKKPSYEEAMLFSIETTYSEKSFGVHKVWYHLPQHMEELKNNFIGLETLIKLNSK